MGPGKTVTVLGGGNVAFDAARSARRLGAEVNVVCLEAREHMLSDEEEIIGAQEEGEKLLSTTFVEFGNGDGTAEISRT